MVEFVSYDGEWPCLCSGVLTVKIDGELVEFPPYILHSGGNVRFDDDWNAFVSHGAWSVGGYDFPNKYLPWINEIEEVVNEHVPYGCCGGCV